MSIYKRFGVEPIIDCAGTSRYGGTLVPEDVRNAMTQALEESVRYDQLQAGASRIIAKHTGAEAGIVTSGAFAGFTLAVAACIARLDVASMNRLPDTADMRNEVLMASGHVGSYDHAVRLAGARIVHVDIPNQLYNPNYNYLPEPWEYEAAITKRTAAIAYIPYRGDCERPSLAGIIEIARRHDIPVIIDAATALPPRANLRKFIEMGADLVTISGGKGLRGPKSSGLLYGKFDLIASAALQSMEYGSLAFPEWDVPESLIPKGRLRGLPQQPIGRGMMASKESVIGLLMALEMYTPERIKNFNEGDRRHLEAIEEQIKGIEGIEVEWIYYTEGERPQLKIKVDEEVSGKTVLGIARELRGGTPPIYVRGDPETYTTPDLPKNVMIINGSSLNVDTASIVAKRLRKALTG